MSKPNFSKLELRRVLRQRRRALPQAHRANTARQLVRSVKTLLEWSSASKIALYMASDGEADPAEIAKALRHSGKTPYLPIIQEDKSLRFAPWTETATLVANRYGILEPQTTSCTAAELDIILLPLVAWDTQGHRLGMGGGYYDRSLAGVQNVIKVGLALELQKVEALVTEPWDIRMDFVATENGLIQCQGEG
ncbi:MAG: 5-formyltetrahydrofolate cyclo-ligase [Halieaceae bacterium]|jgi:5-formyltetrahydrofolate cyclo-ligase|nr:5-formyltetrahydrofolate cyclo-ligase [Halieaceae bacterium]